MKLVIITISLLIAAASASECTSKGGFCASSTSSECNGYWEKGACPGEWNIQCCLADTKCTSQGGECMYTTDSSVCDGSLTSGLCNGPSERKCCLQGGSISPPNGGGNSGNTSGNTSGSSQQDINELKTGLDLIKSMENCHLDAYNDPLSGGKPITIGWGSTRKRDGSRFVLGDRLTQQEADDLFAYQLSNEYLPKLENSIPTWSQMNNNQRGAILSFAYNLGADFYGHRNFNTITRTLSSTSNFGDIRKALILYRNPGSNVERGLLRRRNAEADLFLTPV